MYIIMKIINVITPKKDCRFLKYVAFPVNLRNTAGHEVERDWSQSIFHVNALNQCFRLKPELCYDCLVFRNGIEPDWTLPTVSYQRDILFILNQSVNVKVNWNLGLLFLSKYEQLPYRNTAH